ncbi:MAG: hypothetical protein WCY11_13915, partial [Novosphingobium sp.]
VNAVKSQVRLAERQIVAVKREKMVLETEFLTRANQQQLRALNEVEFGYDAPRADQYIEGERQLAALGKPRGPGAPTPIRVASAADVLEESPLVAMVSPLTGKAVAAQMPKQGVSAPTTDAKMLSDRLTRVDRAEVSRE